MYPLRKCFVVAVFFFCGACLEVYGEYLAWQQAAGYRYANLPVPKTGKTGFTLLSPTNTGILWTNSLPIERLRRRQYFFNGAGVAAGDFDGDGRCDLYFCNKDGSNGLFRNLGDWRFENVAAKAGVRCNDQSSTGAAFADVNGDGLLDLIVTAYTGPGALFLNLGNGAFSNVTASAGLATNGGAFSVALADIDGDGDLDLYVCVYGIDSVVFDGIPFTSRTVNGRQVVTGKRASRLKIENGRLIESGEPDILYRNDGSGHFTPVKWEETFKDEDGNPISAPLDFGLAVQMRDINEDGFPDIYVCNDFRTPDRMWLNDGHGHFRAADRLAFRNMSNDSMGVDFADIDRDGHFDFITVEMLNREHGRRMKLNTSMEGVQRQIGQIDNREDVPRNALFLNRGDRTYAETAYYSGVAASDWSWCPIFLDVDLDGYEDLLVSNGTLPAMSSRDPVPKSQWETPVHDTPNAAFRNLGGARFEDASSLWGFNDTAIGYGMCLADLDGDGDLDVIVNNGNGPPGIYRNDTTAPRVAVRLKGVAPNTYGIGALITLHGGAVPLQKQEMICGGRYVSSDDPMRVFAVGSLTNEMRIEVRWRNGKRSLVTGVKANRIYEIDETGSTEAGSESKPESVPIFEDVSKLINHIHHEDPYDDFAKQPLLPVKLSQMGPGIGWFDVNGDGREDLIIGSGKGGSLAIYLNDEHGGFKKSDQFNQPVTSDQTTILGWTPVANRPVILAGSANYEDGLTNSGSVWQYNFADQTEVDCVPQLEWSTGPMALGDMDGNGELDLFIGGRVASGKYPAAAVSRLYRNDGGYFIPRQDFPFVGLVVGAIWSDLDGDGFPELILACEWGPIRVFKNQPPFGNRPKPPGRRQFQEITKQLGLDRHTGWWSGVAIGDFDGDGKLDIVAGNWGLNTKYQASRDHPRKVYYGELSGNGTTDIIEAYYDEQLKAEVPERDLNAIGAVLPWVREKFSTHLAYSRATIPQIFGERLEQLRVLEASTLETMVFLNRGDYFEARALPLEAQLSPVFGVSVGDFDGDGNEDIFLSQNFFATHPETSRMDAGRGLWLRGDGQGNFAAVPGQVSGVKVYGEQRGAALCDYDADGRVDLAVTQNGAETKLFHNTGAKPGLRVRLKGPPGNPSGIGAQLHLSFGERQGPVREIHAGSGYWSQDSATQVLGTPEKPAQIQIRWPGGKITTNTVPLGAREIIVDSNGELKANASL